MDLDPLYTRHVYKRLYTTMYHVYTLTRSADVGRRHLLAGCGFLPQPPTTAATVFLDTEGGTGFGRIEIAVDARATLGLCGPAAAPVDLLRPVTMSLAKTMAAAAGAPDGCWRLRPGPAIVPSTTAGTTDVVPTPPFNISPTTLGGPVDR